MTTSSVVRTANPRRIVLDDTAGRISRGRARGCGRLGGPAPVPARATVSVPAGTVRDLGGHDLGPWFLAGGEDVEAHNLRLAGFARSDRSLLGC
ncbi:hypothetical protein [Nakamurella endophytica]|nr:hypothetical protein [Nakamurella endophytica]